jgi:stage II sporulation protein D
MHPAPVRRRRSAPAALVALTTACLLGLAAPSAQAAVAVPATFHFGGSGFGHGVGMSQYGALGMAKGGSTASQILTHYYTGTTVAAVADNVPLRVNLLHAATSFTLGSKAAATGGGTIQVTVNGLPHVLGTAADTWTVAVSGSLVSVRKNGATVGSGSTVGIYWAGTRVPGSAGSAATLALVNGTAYRYGDIDVRVVSGRLEVNNVVLVHDEYLRGVAEMPSSWPAAALQAQVAASRSYALVKYAAGIRSACWCHVYDSTADQVFAGWSKESGSYGTQWRAAVAATEPSSTTGWAVLYGGRPVQAYYFSSSGGRTQNSEDVWVTALPWARSVDDHWSLDPAVNPTYADWGVDRTQAQVAAAFGLTDVVKVSLASRTLGGGVATATAWSSTGASASVSGETLRSRLTLPATWLHRDALRLAGADRWSTSVAVAKQAVPSGSTVVIVSGDTANVIDGVAAAPLAVRKGAPLLLATATGLPPATAAEVTRRHATTAYVVGDTTALGDGVVTELKSLGVTTVIRLAGADPAGTAAAVATAMQRPVGTRAALVNADDVAGALAVAGPAARAGRPVLLVDAGDIPAATQQVLDTLKPLAVSVVGSTTEVSDAVLAQLPTPARIAGTDQYDTSLAVGRAFAPLAGTSDVVLVSGVDGTLTDALTASGLGRVTLLTTAAPSAGVTDWLQRQPGVHRVVAVGGTGVVPDATLRVAELA